MRGATVAGLSPLWNFLGEASGKTLEKGSAGGRSASISAHVIARSVSSWNSVIWVNVGEENNVKAGKKIVGDNSPVVIGDAVVGLVDYVGKKHSRVRLITDPQLTIAVRAARGHPQFVDVADHMDTLLRLLELQNVLPAPIEEQKSLYSQLQRLKSRLEEEAPSYFLAKGEVCGSSDIRWRRGGHLLKGTGFNYDFSDASGEARDLRTGEPYSRSSEEKSMPILQVGDLLITTGMDGIFPEGLKVAEVIAIDVLSEGAYYYDLQAKPAVGSLEALSYLEILPPSDYGLIGSAFSNQ